MPTTPTARTAPTTATTPTAAGFWWWLLVGALVAFGVVGLASIGMFLLAGAAVLVAVALLVPALRAPSLPGLLLGAATAPLFIAWINRSGPGTVCTTTATTSSCTDQWSPWPFLAVALALAAAGVWLLLRGRHPRDPGATPTPEAAGVSPQP